MSFSNLTSYIVYMSLRSSKDSSFNLSVLFLIASSYRSLNVFLFSLFIMYTPLSYSKICSIYCLYYITRTYFRQLIILLTHFLNCIIFRTVKTILSTNVDTFFHLYSDSYKSSIFTCKCSANFSIVSILGILLPVAILCSVDLLMPVKISNCLYDNPFLFICSAKSIFISSPIGIFSF